MRAAARSSLSVVYAPNAATAVDTRDMPLRRDALTREQSADVSITRAITVCASVVECHAIDFRARLCLMRYARLLMPMPAIRRFMMPPMNSSQQQRADYAFILFYAHY